MEPDLDGRTVLALQSRCQQSGAIWPTLVWTRPSRETLVRVQLVSSEGAAATAAMLPSPRLATSKSGAASVHARKTTSAGTLRAPGRGRQHSW
eukprot:4035187-Prymnesium_polylepis.2